MHETALIEEILTEALEVAGRRHGRVTRIEIEASRQGHMTEDLVRQQVEILSRGTAAEGARLDVRWLDPAYRCFDCGTSFVATGVSIVAECPRCGGLALPLETRHELSLAAVETDPPERRARRRAERQED